MRLSAVFLLKIFFFLGAFSLQAMATPLCSGAFPTPQFEVIEMFPKYKGEENGVDVWNDAVTRRFHYHTRYLRTPEERAAFLVSINEKGQFIDAKGKVIDTTTGGEHHDGRAIYIMTLEGQIYIGKSIEQKFHHSSFLAGAPVASSGEIRIKKGVPTYISNNSGHYRGKRPHFQQFIDTIENRGVDTSKAELDGSFSVFF